MTQTATPPDWSVLMETWDRQQQGYVPAREQLFTTMLDATEAIVGQAPVALDLACGPGTISARLLERFPNARGVAVDLDPLLMAIGRGALGDMDGRLRWLEADLRTDGWEAALRDEKFDVVLTSTATHWLTPDELLATYRTIGDILRPGGLFLNADRFEFDQRSPTCKTLTTSLTQTRWKKAFEHDTIDDWASWWESLAGHPTLDALLDVRKRRFANRVNESGRRPSLPTLTYHLGALTEAGFRECDTIWQDLNRRLLLAIRDG